jgi:hypothetical protein
MSRVPVVFFPSAMLIVLGAAGLHNEVAALKYTGITLYQDFFAPVDYARLVRRSKDIPRIRFHDIRYSHATESLLAEVHPKVVQERLGHSTISVTLDLYSHVTPNDAGELCASSSANRAW